VTDASRDLEGRVVLVTGSSRGIGAEVAVMAAVRGATVGVHYQVAADKAERTLARIREAGGTGEAFAADLSDGDQARGLVNDAIAAFGHVDGLVNNAGRTQVGPFLDLERDEWDAVIATDLTAAYHTCRAVLPSMVERGSGSIVNVASRLGQAGVPQTAAYSAAKAGLIGLTRSLAVEFGGRGIRVNAVAPGFTLTEMTADLAQSDTGKARMRMMPVGRFAEAHEVAAAVVFLLSDAASMFLGQTLNPNGGAHMP
jgi:3-oxoacyl-[acyl-carrier protein] reductase